MEFTLPERKQEEVSGQEHLEQAKKPEQKESFESQYEKLATESFRIQNEREATFALEHMESEGLQTLINEYGVDSVFDAINKLKSKNEIFSTFEVIRTLTPDKATRNVLYEKILNDAKVQSEQFDTETLGTDAYHKDCPENFILGTQFRVDSMKSLDTLLGKLNSEHHYTILNSRMYDFATSISTVGEAEIRIKEELANAGNDIFRLVEERNKIINVRTESLGSRVDELVGELSTEIDRITDEIRMKLEEYRTRVVGDLGKVMNLETDSEEMRVALQSALQKVESEIVQKVESAEKEIADKTGSLRETMDKTLSLNHVYFMHRTKTAETKSPVE
jgi:hypothetical protein